MINKDKILKSLGLSKIANRAIELATLARPAILLKVPTTEKSTDNFSKFGGDPEMPIDLAWPVTERGDCLSFLMQIDLSEMRLVSHESFALPAEGRLYFFYDFNEEPWGFDPKHKHGWRVLFHPSSIDCITRTPPVYKKEKDPEPTNFFESVKSLFTYHSEPPQPARFLPFPLVFESFWSMPQYDSVKIEALRLTEEELDCYSNWWEQYQEQNVVAQSFGYPSPIQGDDMETDCQLVSNGVYIGDTTGYQSERAKELLSLPIDWLLLLQIEANDKLNVGWGDCGTLYFWIREQDSRKADFDNVWAIVQCF